MIAQMIAMIAPHHDDRIVVQPDFPQRIENPTDLRVRIGGAGVITVYEAALNFRIEFRPGI